MNEQAITTPSPSQTGQEGLAAPVGMLVYNLLVRAYFLSFGARAPDIGPLLWPVAVFHVVFAALLARALRGLI
jgi:hypothetical protein